MGDAETHSPGDPNRTSDRNTEVSSNHKTVRWAPLGDVWTPSFETIPSLKYFMVGPDKLDAIARLKTAVLESDNEVAGATVGLHGCGGVGKTVASVVIANDPDIQEHFRDAVLWMQLGDGATRATIVKQVARIVASTGGSQAAATIAEFGEARLHGVKETAARWFHGRRVLLVVDNVFASTQLGSIRALLDVLRDIPGPNSCLLFSTRFRDIARLGDIRVEFKPLENTENVAQNEIFLAHLGLPRSELDERFDRKMSAKALTFCHGFPIALACAAGVVRRLQYNWERAFSLLDELLLEAEKNIFDRGGHEGLPSVLSAGLRVLESSRSQLGNAEQHGATWTDLYLSLGVMDKSFPRIPIIVLALMWGVTLETARTICEAIADVSLGWLSDSCTPGKQYLELHDLQLAYCERKARSTPRTEHILRTWHARLVRKFVEQWKTVPSNHGVDEHLRGVDFEALTRAFCSAQGMVEEYFVDNLVRHLCGSVELVKTAVELVTEYRWMRKLAARRSLAAVARCYELVIQTVETAQLDADIVDELRAIYRVLNDRVPQDTASSLTSLAAYGQCHLHPTGLAGDPGLAHQLFGRLGFPCSFRNGISESRVQTPAESKFRGVFVVKLLQSVQDHARKPFLRPVGECFDEYHCGSCIRVIALGHFSRCAAFLDADCNFMVVGHRCGMFVLDISTGERVREIWNERVDQENPVTCIAASKVLDSLSSDDKVSARAGLAVAGHADGTIRVWDSGSWKALSILIGHEQALTEVKISSMRKVIISFSAMETVVRVWIHRTGSAWACSLVLTCESAVEYQYISAEIMTNVRADVAHEERYLAFAQRVSASASAAEGQDLIRDSKVPSSVRYVARLEFCCLATLVGGVKVIELSGPGPWQIEVRESNTRQLHLGPRAIPGLSDVESVAAFSGRNGNILVTGHRSGLVQLRGLETGYLIGERKGHTMPVLQIAVDDACKRMATIAWDGAMRVWSIQEDEQDAYYGAPDARPPGVVHTGPLMSVAASEDGSLYASCAEHDAVVRIYDAKTGSCIRKLEVEPGSDCSGVAISPNGDWVVCAGIDAGGDTYFVSVWDSKGHCVSRNVRDGSWLFPRVQWVESVAIARNGVHCAVVFNTGHGRHSLCGTVWSITKSRLKLQHALKKGAPECAAELLDSWLGPGKSWEIRASRRSASDYSIEERNGAVVVRPACTQTMMKSGGRKSCATADVRCSCPARARFDAGMHNGTLCVVPVPWHGDVAQSKRFAVAGTYDGRVSFLEIVRNVDGD